MTLMNQSESQRGRPRNDCGLPLWSGPTLRSLRQMRGMSATDVAEGVGVSRATVYRWERHGSQRVATSHMPTRDQLRALAKLFRVSLKTFSRQAKLTFKD